ncbi:MAG: universal stress protein [Desulfomonile tiedjei]|nr:universal stress protein [Desulfomonile tiedjei]
MFSRIIVAVDGSESSYHALRQACRLARAEGGAIRVIAVTPPYEGELRLVGVRQHVAEMVSEPYKKALAKSVEIADSLGISVQTVLEQGEPHEQIVNAAESLGCDLIVVGVRGCNPAEKLLMGSMTARVIGCSHIDVLVVPGDKQIATDSILVAVDGSEFGKVAAKRAFDLQKSYGSRVLVISVADVPEHLYGLDAGVAQGMIDRARKNLEDVGKEADSVAAKAEMLLHEGDPARIITEIATKMTVGMVIVGSHGHTRFKRLLMGSVTERVIGNAPCPILITRN